MKDRLQKTLNCWRKHKLRFVAGKVEMLISYVELHRTRLQQVADGCDNRSSSNLFVCGCVAIY
jgi:hypothetical protein